MLSSSDKHAGIASDDNEYYNIGDIYKATDQGSNLLIIRFSLTKPGESKREELVEVTLRDYGGDIARYYYYETVAESWKKPKNKILIFPNKIDYAPLYGELRGMEREVRGGNNIAGIIKIIPTHSNDEEYKAILSKELELLNDFFYSNIIERLKIKHAPIVFACTAIDSDIHNPQNYGDRGRDYQTHLERVIGLAKDNLLLNLEGFARIKAHQGEKFIVPTAGFSREYITKAFGNMHNKEVQRITKGYKIRVDATIEPWNTLSVLLLLIYKYLKKEGDKEGSKAVMDLLSRYSDMNNEKKGKNKTSSEAHEVHE